MMVERDGPYQVCFGSEGRVYRISYIPGAVKPWIVNGDTALEHRQVTLDDAIAYAHQLEATQQGER